MEFSGFEEKILGAIDDCKGSIKHCGRNAAQHLEKAWVIRDLDIEMAAFRGITAEEEAASAVFHCLKNHRYTNSHKLEFKQHPYKLGIFPFLESIRNSFATFVDVNNFPIERFVLGHIEKSGRRALELILKMPSLGVDARPQPPLHFSFKNSETGWPVTFEADFMRLIEGQNYTNALKYIINRSNQRNQLLYAHNAGIPKVEGDIESFLLRQKVRVFGLLAIVLLIDPWEKEEGRSMFVQQALDAYLLLQGKIRAEEVSWRNK